MDLRHELDQTLCMVLAGGQGERLLPLTAQRAKPAVPFGGAYRIIDFTLSNCIHSGLRRIYVLTQYRGRSLEEHIRFGWNFLPRRLGQFISVRPPHHGGLDTWYHGTAHAIAMNLEAIDAARPRHVLVLSGDHVYKMDYGRMIAEHVEQDAALTIGSIAVRREEAHRFGVFEVGSGGDVVAFHEKPTDPPEMPGRPGWCLASMGIYVFRSEELVKRLLQDATREDSSHDFGKDIIPRMIGEVKVRAHAFHDVDGRPEPYWRDVGTIEAYYEANLDLCCVEPSLNLYDDSWPIYTLWHNEPPAKTVLGEPGRRSDVVDSLLCPGVIVSGGVVHRSILSNRCRVAEQASVEDAILLSGVRVGAGTRIRRAIIEKWLTIPEGESIGHEPDRDRIRFHASEAGIIVVTADHARTQWGEAAVARR